MLQTRRGRPVGTQPVLTGLQSPRLCDGKRVYCQTLEAHRGSDLQWMRGHSQRRRLGGSVPASRGHGVCSRRSVEMSSGCRSRQPSTPRMAMAQRALRVVWVQILVQMVYSGVCVGERARTFCVLPGSPVPSLQPGVPVPRPPPVPLFTTVVFHSPSGARVCLFLVWL